VTNSTGGYSVPPAPLPDGFAALLSDGERNAEEDSASRRDFQDSKSAFIGVHLRFLFSVLFKNQDSTMHARLNGVISAHGIFIII